MRPSLMTSAPLQWLCSSSLAPVGPKGWGAPAGLGVGPPGFAMKFHTRRHNDNQQNPNTKHKGSWSTTEDYHVLRVSCIRRWRRMGKPERNPPANIGPVPPAHPYAFAPTPNRPTDKALQPTIASTGPCQVRKPRLEYRDVSHTNLTHNMMSSRQSFRIGEVAIADTSLGSPIQPEADPI